EVRMCELKDIPENDFDLIVANIQRNILIDLSEGLKNKLNKDGILILSGLLESDREEIMRKYLSIGFNEIEMMQIEEWIGIVLKKTE
ncbi:MAG: 50S ribosomal protein L11 methyltransferase, partial [Ignavibacterium sp.]